MRIQLESDKTANLIRTYGPGQVVVNDTTYRQSVIVLPEQLVPGWPPRTIGDLTEHHIRQLVELDVEIVIIGTGTTLRFPPASVLRPLFDAGRGFEVMDNGAACRTYNVLTTEGRRVAAALLVGTESSAN